MGTSVKERTKRKVSRLVPAGLESNLTSQKPTKPMPTAKSYSKKTKIQSPISRGI